MEKRPFRIVFDSPESFERWFLSLKVEHQAKVMLLVTEAVNLGLPIPLACNVTYQVMVEKFPGISVDAPDNLIDFPDSGSVN